LVAIRGAGLPGKRSPSYSARESCRRSRQSDRLRIEIRQARFLLADLTQANNGAYWEAGYAEGLGKPVIYLCEKSYFAKMSTHFDTNHHLTILWDMSTIGDDMDRLTATIRFSIPEARQTD